MRLGQKILLKRNIKGLTQSGIVVLIQERMAPKLLDGKTVLKIYTL